MLTDYAQVRQERIFARSQFVMGVYNMPKPRDALKLRGRAVLPSVLSDFVRSEEIRDTPDTDQLIKRKKPPGELELTMYAKAPTTPGRPPQWGVLARDTFGYEIMIVTVLAFGPLTGKTFTVTQDGVPTVLPGTWSAGASNNAVATSLAAAIEAVTGLTAVAVGPEVRVQRDQGTGEVALSSNALLTDLRLGETRYQLATPILEQVLTIVHGTDNSASYYRDCKINSMTVRVSGEDEAVLVFGGWLGNETVMSQSKLEGAIALGAPRTAADEVMFGLETDVVVIGPTDEDVTWFKAGTEVFRVTAWDPASKTGAAKGCQFGTAAAAHLDGEEVFPYLPDSDPDENDHITPLTLGHVKFDGVEYRVINFEVTKNETITPRMDEYAEAALTGYRRSLEGRTVEGTMVAYQRLSIMELQGRAEREQQSDVELMIGDPDAPISARIVVNIPRLRIGKPEKGETEGEFTRTFPVQGMASSTPGNDGIDLQVFA